MVRACSAAAHLDRCPSPLAGASDSDDHTTSQKILRPTPQPMHTYTPSIGTKKEAKEDPRLVEFFSMASALGYSVTKNQRLEQEFVLAISNRLVPRKGDKIYQVAAFTLTSFPLQVLEMLIPGRHKLGGATATAVSWSVTSTPSVREIIGEIMTSLRNLSSGTSRGQMTESESVIRVLATMLVSDSSPLSISWWQPIEGTARVSINFMYVLMQGTGDMHPPKDNDRREILLTAAEQQAVRAAAL